MSDNNPVDTGTPAVDTDTDLDAFSSDFFGQKKDTPVETTMAGKSEPEDVDDSAPSDAHSDADDTGTDLDDDDSSTEDETSKPKKKTRFQERIDELTAKAKEAERRAEAAEAQLKGQNPAPDKTPTKAPAPELVEPTPHDLNEDGTEKYELGEFDPQYIKDLTKFALKSEKAAIEAEADRTKQIEQMNAEKAELETSWAEKLPSAQERYPDFREKGEALVSTFDGINEAYGEYLTATIMSLENGTDVLYYLANNIDEANKIVAAGPSRATIMLGKLDAYFDDDDAEPETPPPARKVSQAKAPPPQNKGNSAAKAQIPDDTDDLDAFSTKLFDKRYGKRR